MVGLRCVAAAWARAPREWVAGTWVRALAGAAAAPAKAGPSAEQLSVAVVGSGPAGFYTADRLNRLLGDGVHIDIVERLPTPFGLVRSGVAPDHPDTKNVVNKFTAVAERPNTRFFGNVAVGAAVSVPELRQLYDAVVLAYGAPSDRALGVPGEGARGCLSAREFVNWYNGHPEAASPPVDLGGVTSVAIVGLGNVALDCARLLLRPPADLAGTDIAPDAFAALKRSAVQEVHVVGRRGPMQAQFSGKELREVLGLANVAIEMHPAGYMPTDADLKAPRKNQKAVAAMQAAHGKAAQEGAWPERRLHFRFLQTPSALHTSPGGDVAALELCANELATDATGVQTAQLTGETSIIAAQLVLKSVGYFGTPLPGVPFDERRGVVPSEMGRVLEGHGDAAAAVPGLYVTGWLKRGPSGIIGTNLVDAEQTAGCVWEDAQSLKRGRSRAHDPRALQALLEERQVPVVTWDYWRRIDEAEQELGAAEGKPRVKLCTTTELLAAAGLQ